jgi:hypothetical protein
MFCGAVNFESVISFQHLKHPKIGSEVIIQGSPLSPLKAFRGYFFTKSSIQLSVKGGSGRFS